MFDVIAVHSRLICYLFVALFLFWIAGRAFWLNQSGLGLSFVISFDYAACSRDYGIWLLLLQDMVVESFVQ